MKRLIAVILAIVLALSCIACSKSAAVEETQTASTVSKKEIRVSDYRPPDTLDPCASPNLITQRISKNVYDGLVFIDKDLNYQPAVATSWEQVDSLTWVFEISDKYVFQNGEPLEMEDVVYSILRLKDTALVSEAASGIADVTYEGRTLTVTLKEENNSVMPIVLCWLCIMNKSYVDEMGDDALNLKPCGTGPYAVTSYDPANKVVLEAWDGYPFEQPDIKKITFVGDTESANRYIAVETNQSQMCSNLGYTDGMRAKEASGIEVAEVPDVGVAAILFNTVSGPCANANVRKALAYAMNRDDWCAISQGCIPIYSMIAASLPEYAGSAEQYPAYDLDKAKELLEAEGYTVANPLVLECYTHMSETALESYQAILSTIGVTMNINNVGVAAYQDATASGDYDLLFSRYMNRTNVALEDLDYYAADTSKNPTGYQNDEIEALIVTAKTSSDASEVQAAFEEIQAIAAEDLHMLPICTPMNYWAYSSALGNVLIRQNGMLSFYDITLN